MFWRSIGFFDNGLALPVPNLSFLLVNIFDSLYCVASMLTPFSFPLLHSVCINIFSFFHVFVLYVFLLVSVTIRAFLCSF